MTIDSVAKDIEWLTKYEAPKTSILSRVLDGLRVLQAAGDKEGMKNEMSLLINILRRIDAVIPGEIERFKGNRSVLEKLESQRRILGDLRRYAEFYKAEKESNNLNSLYNKIFEGITNFIILSKSLITAKIAQKAA